MTHAPWNTYEAAAWVAKELTERQIRARCGAIHAEATEFAYEARRHDSREDPCRATYGIIGRWKYADRPDLGWFGGQFVWNPHKLTEKVDG